MRGEGGQGDRSSVIHHRERLHSLLLLFYLARVGSTQITKLILILERCELTDTKVD